MNIQTKFDIGDEVQFKENNVTCNAVVWEITTHTTKQGTFESYLLCTSGGRLTTKPIYQITKAAAKLQPFLK